MYIRVSQLLTCCDHTFGKIFSLTKPSLVNLVNNLKFDQKTHIQVSLTTVWSILVKRPQVEKTRCTLYIDIFTVHMNTLMSCVYVCYKYISKLYPRYFFFC